jgi:hypothetical protein
MGSLGVNVAGSIEPDGPDRNLDIRISLYQDVFRRWPRMAADEGV